MFPQAVTLQHNRQFSRRWPTAQIGFNNPRRRHNASTCKNSPDKLYQAVLAKVGDRAEVRRVIGRQHKDPLSQSSGLGIGPGRYNRRFITDVIVCIGRWRCSGLEGLGI